MAARKSTSPNLVSLPAPAPALPAAVLGILVAFDPERGPLVDYPGNPAGPLPARLLVAADPDLLQRSAAARTPTALVFEAGDPARPLILGFVQPPAPPARDLRVDGKRVVLTGEEEVELRCGEASISLKRSGKLVIRGTYVETRAKGTNRIKGGSVQIN